MTHPDSPLRYLLTAYIFGDITEEGAREVEEQLARDPRCRAELERLRATLDLVGGVLAEEKVAEGEYRFEERRLERVLQARPRRVKPAFVYAAAALLLFSLLSAVLVPTMMGARGRTKGFRHLARSGMPAPDSARTGRDGSSPLDAEEDDRGASTDDVTSPPVMESPVMDSPVLESAKVVMEPVGGMDALAERSDRTVAPPKTAVPLRESRTARRVVRRPELLEREKKTILKLKPDVVVAEESRVLANKDLRKLQSEIGAATGEGESRDKATDASRGRWGAEVLDAFGASGGGRGAYGRRTGLAENRVEREQGAGAPTARKPRAPADAGEAPPGSAGLVRSFEGPEIRLPGDELGRDASDPFGFGRSPDSGAVHRWNRARPQAGGGDRAGALAGEFDARGERTGLEVGALAADEKTLVDEGRAPVSKERARGGRVADTHAGQGRRQEDRWAFDDGPGGETPPAPTESPGPPRTETGYGPGTLALRDGVSSPPAESPAPLLASPGWAGEGALVDVPVQFISPAPVADPVAIPPISTFDLSIQHAGDAAALDLQVPGWKKGAGGPSIWTLVPGKPDDSTIGVRVMPQPQPVPGADSLLRKTPTAGAAPVFGERTLGDASSPAVSSPTDGSSPTAGGVRAPEDFHVRSFGYLPGPAGGQGGSGSRSSTASATREESPRERQLAAAEELAEDGDEDLPESITFYGARFADDVSAQADDELSPALRLLADSLAGRGDPLQYERRLLAYQYFHRIDPRLTLRDYLARPVDVPRPSRGDEGLGREGFRERHGVNPFVDTRRDPQSTFAMDVDTASFTHARGEIAAGRLPDPESVRVEEFINYFHADVEPDPELDFTVASEGGPSPFGPGSDLLEIRVRARELAPEERLRAILTVAIDTSGSMLLDERLARARAALVMLVQALAPEDRVAIVAYGSQPYLALPHTPVRERSRILGAIDALRPGGDTNVEAGLELAYRVADDARAERAVHRVLLISDGVATQGARGAEELLERVRVFAHRGIYLSVVGFGQMRYDDDFLERLADGGNGHYAHVDRPEEAARLFFEELPGALQVLAADAKIQVEFDPEVVARYRLLGYENRDVADRDFRNDAVDAGEVAPGATVTALYEVERQPGSAGPLGTVRVRYRSTITQRVEELAFPLRPGVVAQAPELVSDRFLFTACVAQAAELLRESYWARGETWAELLHVLQGISPAYQSRPEWRELFALAEGASTLTLAKLLREAVVR